jgi:hypothetical protein
MNKNETIYQVSGEISRRISISKSHQNFTTTANKRMKITFFNKFIIFFFIDWR